MLEFQNEFQANTKSVTIPIDVRTLLWAYFDSIKDQTIKLNWKIFGIPIHPSFKIADLEFVMVKIFGPRP